MSEFHGGFFVKSREPHIQEPIRRALADRLRALKLDPAQHRLTFATREGSPVLHVAVRGPAADGKDYAFFHQQHEDLGGDVARAAGAVTWVYAYENQVGTESVARFEPSGSRTSSIFASWDDAADEHELDLDEPGALQRLMKLLPLGVLADELGAPRELLDMALAYETPTVDVPLVGDADPDALARYLSGPLTSMPALPEVEKGATQALYFPAQMANDTRQLAQRLRLSVGRVFAIAWELAKSDIYPATPGIGSDGAEVGPLPAPPSRPIPDLRIPAEAPPLAELPKDGSQVKLSLALPEEMLTELVEWARHLDRSLSWCVQRAYLAARSRLHAATPTRQPEG